MLNNGAVISNKIDSNNTGYNRSECPSSNSDSFPDLLAWKIVEEGEEDIETDPEIEEDMEDCFWSTNKWWLLSLFYIFFIFLLVMIILF